MTSSSFGPGVSAAVATALEARGITSLFPIQREVVPLADEGRDILARSPTGSGKTIAFGIPLVQALDLDSEQAAMALAAGARLTINTDAHRTSTLALRDHGVAVARRAGARPEDVVNCLHLDELQRTRRRHR